MGDGRNTPTGDAPPPLLAVVGSGDRRYREYLVAALHRHFRLWLLDTEAPTWQRRYLTGFTRTDTRDPGALVRAVRAIGHHRPAGLLSYDEWLVEATAAAADRLGMPTSPPAAVARCRDKAATRSHLAARGIAQPRSRPVASTTEAVEAAGEIGYPVVVKARRLAGSIAVRRADDARAVEEAYRDAAGTIFPGVANDGADVLIEEYLDGPEISVDSVVADGRVTPLVLARKRTGLTPYFEETGHVVDADDPLLRDDGLLEQLRRVHAGIGLTFGMTHTEFRLTRGGPRLVEVNARLGGDFIPYLGHLATGVDLAVVAGRVATGGSPVTSPTGRRVAGVRFLYPPADCRVREVVVHADRCDETVHAAVATAEPGRWMALPPRGFLSRYGYLIVTADTVARAHRALDRAAEIIDLRYDAVRPDGPTAAGDRPGATTTTRAGSDARGPVSDRIPPTIDID